MPTLSEERPAFWHRAACAVYGDNLFFPVGDTGEAIEIIAAAKRICDGCAVSDACLDFALETNQAYGIWGGTTERERSRLRRRLLAAQRARAPRAMAG